MNGHESEPLIRGIGSSSTPNDRPLFGDRSGRTDRIINIALISACGILILITTITLITIKFTAINLITIFVILSITGANVTLIHWYRLGDLDPKFRYLILWSSVNLCLLCIVAICTFDSIQKLSEYTNNTHPKELIKSSHQLHDCDKTFNNLIPIVYNERYDIYFYKIESIHPFDTKKWGKIAKHLHDYFNGVKPNEKKKKRNTINVITFVSPLRPINEHELDLVHSQSFIHNIHNSRLTIAQASEVPILFFCPLIIIKNKLLTPLKWQTSGSILAGFLALQHQWSINLGGGFHHCSGESAGGFCLFADITLMIRYLWKEVNNKLKVMIVDCDAHQGNGYARDVIDMPTQERNLIYIMDMFNPSIYPHDEHAKSAITRLIALHPGTEDRTYLELLTYHINEAIMEFHPNLIVYNAGTDILKGDPLGLLNISPIGIVKRDEIVFKTAFNYNCSVVMLTSGGYQMSNAQIIADSIINLFDKGIIKKLNA